MRKGRFNKLVGMKPVLTCIIGYMSSFKDVRSFKNTNQDFSESIFEILVETSNYKEKIDFLMTTEKERKVKKTEGCRAIVRKINALHQFHFRYIAKDPEAAPPRIPYFLRKHVRRRIRPLAILNAYLGVAAWCFSGFSLIVSVIIVMIAIFRDASLCAEEILHEIVASGIAQNSTNKDCCAQKPPCLITPADANEQLNSGANLFFTIGLIFFCMASSALIIAIISIGLCKICSLYESILEEKENASNSEMYAFFNKAEGVESNFEADHEYQPIATEQPCQRSSIN